MFNFQGSELIIIMLLALVVLGPEKLPEAMRKLGGYYAQLKKMSTGFQEEFRAAVDEPMRELRSTADLLRDSADFRTFQAGGRDEKPKSAEMADAPTADSTGAAGDGSGDAAADGADDVAPAVPADAMSEAITRLPPAGPTPADRRTPFSAAQRSSAAAPRRANDGASLHEAAAPPAAEPTPNGTAGASDDATHGTAPDGEQGDPAPDDTDAVATDGNTA